MANEDAGQNGSPLHPLLQHLLQQGDIGRGRRRFGQHQPGLPSLWIGRSERFQQTGRRGLSVKPQARLARAEDNGGSEGHIFPDWRHHRRSGGTVVAHRHVAQPVADGSFVHVVTQGDVQRFGGLVQDLVHEAAPETQSFPLRLCLHQHGLRVYREAHLLWAQQQSLFAVIDPHRFRVVGGADGLGDFIEVRARGRLPGQRDPARHRPLGLCVVPGPGSQRDDGENQDEKKQTCEVAHRSRLATQQRGGSRPATVSTATDSSPHCTDAHRRSKTHKPTPRPGPGSEHRRPRDGQSA